MLALIHYNGVEASCRTNIKIGEKNMYAITGKFNSSQEARSVYNTVNGFVKKLHLDALVTRLRSGSNSYVDFTFDGEISQLPPDAAQTIHHLLSQGQTIQLPPETRAAIEQRMREKRKQQKERDLQAAFLKDPAAYLAALEERFLSATQDTSEEHRRESNND